MSVLKKSTMCNLGALQPVKLGYELHASTTIHTPFAWSPSIRDVNKQSVLLAPGANVLF